MVHRGVYATVHITEVFFSNQFSRTKLLRKNKGKGKEGKQYSIITLYIYIEEGDENSSKNHRARTNFVWILLFISFYFFIFFSSIKKPIGSHENVTTLFNTIRV